MDVQKVIDELDSIYGSGSGMKVYTTIMPGILGDFNRMLEGSQKGMTLKEEYRLEDGKAVLYVTGVRLANGQTDIDVKVGKIY